jgi:hypothetical protein
VRAHILSRQPSIQVTCPQRKLDHVKSPHIRHNKQNNNGQTKSNLHFLLNYSQLNKSLIKNKKCLWKYRIYQSRTSPGKQQLACCILWRMMSSHQVSKEVSTLSSIVPCKHRRTLKFLFRLTKSLQIKLISRLMHHQSLFLIKICVVQLTGPWMSYWSLEAVK